MSTFGQIGAMLSRGAGKDRDIKDMPERIKNMEGFISKMREWLEPQDDAAILHWIELADGLAQGYERTNERRLSGRYRKRSMQNKRNKIDSSRSGLLTVKKRFVLRRAGAIVFTA